MSENPYTTPETSPELTQFDQDVHPSELASRWARLGASIIDGIIIMIIIIPIFFLIFMFFLNSESSTVGFFEALAASGNDIIINVVSTIIGILVYLVVNGYFMVRNGQTLGKKALGIRVIDYQNEQLNHNCF